MFCLKWAGVGAACVFSIFPKRRSFFLSAKKTMNLLKWKKEMSPLIFFLPNDRKSVPGFPLLSRFWYQTWPRQKLFRQDRRRARITTTIVCSKNIHVLQCDGGTTTFYLCLTLTSILCQKNIHLCVVRKSMFGANDVITSTTFLKAFYAQKQFKNKVRLWLGYG